MSEQVVYLYAIGRGLEAADVAGLAGVDGGTTFGVASAAGLTALYSLVDRAAWSQEAIDARATDLDWLGEVGFRHEAVVEKITSARTAIPMRAFTLFSSPAAVEELLEARSPGLERLLQSIEGRDEWTIRIEFEPARWRDALARRVDSLRELSEQAATATGGKAYLLKKKLDDARVRAAREGEDRLVQEVEQLFAKRLDAPSVVETRQQKSGSFPQINLLVRRSDAESMRALRDEAAGRYAGDGVSLVLTGPWPPYTFTRGEDR